MGKRVNNKEKIMVALLSTRTLAEASEVSGVSTRSISRAKENPEFMQELEERRKEILDGTCKLLQSQIYEAVLTAVDIMEDDNNSPQVRLNAVDLIIRNTYKLTELTDTKKLLKTLEERLNGLSVIDP